MNKIWSLIKDNKGFVIFIIFLIVFRGAVADWIHLKENHLIVNGNVVDYQKIADIYIEDSGEKKIRMFPGSNADSIPLRISDQEPGRYAIESYTDLKPHAVNLKDMNSNYNK